MKGLIIVHGSAGRWGRTRQSKLDQSPQTCTYLWCVQPYLPACSRGALTSSSSSSWAQVRRCSPLTVMTLCQDGPFDHWAVALQRGSQNKEDNCKVSAQEICGNKVSTCHSCEMLLKAHSSADNGSLSKCKCFYFVCGAQAVSLLCRTASLGLNHLLY